MENRWGGLRAYLRQGREPPGYVPSTGRVLEIMHTLEQDLNHIDKMEARKDER